MHTNLVGLILKVIWGKHWKQKIRPMHLLYNEKQPYNILMYIIFIFYSFFLCFYHLKNIMLTSVLDESNSWNTITSKFI